MNRAYINRAVWTVSLAGVSVSTNKSANKSKNKKQYFRLPKEITPNRYLLAVLRMRPWTLLVCIVFNIFSLLPGALIPLVIGHGVEAIGDRDWARLWQSVLVIVVLGLVQAGGKAIDQFSHQSLWITVVVELQGGITRHVAGLGSVLQKSTSTGDVSSVFYDTRVIANVPGDLSRAVASVVAFIVAGAILMHSSPLLGLIALIGIPLMMFSIRPFLARLQERQRIRRQMLGEATNSAGDIVSGLRILRGIGGESKFFGRFVETSQQVRSTGLKLGRSETWLEVASTVLPGLITVVITWLAARLAITGVISVGELISFYGMSVFLVIPVASIIRTLRIAIGARTGAERICAVLRIQPKLADKKLPTVLPDEPLGLYDSETDFTAVAGKLTVVDAGEEAESLAGRLARFSDAAEGEHVHVGGVSVDQIAISELRARVVYAHNQDLWFSGVMQDQLVTSKPSTVDVSTALFTANADDIIDALPMGIHEFIGERGREISGGQRQRLILARVLVMDPDVLILDEPTSAVDANTEALIAERVAKLRCGKTTVVFSQSPLWISAADKVFHFGVSR